MKQSFGNNVKIISLEEFLDTFDYLTDNMPNFPTNMRPQSFLSYKKITSEMFIAVYYTGNFFEREAVLENIFVAFRDGKTEYELFDNKIQVLEKELSLHKRSKKIRTSLESLKKSFESLTPFKSIDNNRSPKPFDSYVINNNYLSLNKDLAKDYVVLDVETNGLNPFTDDLLSISIYNPLTGEIYNRFLPLDMQPLVLTTWINGITEDMLQYEADLTQEEIDFLIDRFRLKDRVVLLYCGSNKNLFDVNFLVSYCKRHNLNGFEDLKYKNIKSIFPPTPRECRGQMTKDNLCRIFGIIGVREVHSGFNDCILEWKLFEKGYNSKLFFISNFLYEYSPEYIVPVSYLNSHKELIKYANIDVPSVVGLVKPIFEYKFPKEVLENAQKFSNNITGITIEHAINTELNVEKQNNLSFLSKNKSNLKYIGCLHSYLHEIPIIEERDGTIKALKKEDKPFVDDVNKVTKLIMKYLYNITDFIKQNIFTDDEKIMSQELCISDDNKVLAVCDLSNSVSVLEIKTLNVIKETKKYGISLEDKIARQLFYESKGRDAYVLSVVFNEKYSWKFGNILESLICTIYKVDFKKR